jgi:DNA topoisomerase-1
MAKNLLIVESPAKTRTLSRFLGKDFDILATVGHIRDLPKSKLGVNPERDFEPEYVVIKGKEKVIRELKKAAKNAKRIYLAPDPDREGEAIAWHVAASLEKGSKAELVRVAFNEITKPAVTEAIANPRDIDMNLVNAQQARRILDRIVGYTVSPFLWSTVARNLSAGRVQSVALRLIVEREEAVKAFKPQEYWQLQAELETKKRERFTARLFKIDDVTVVSPNGTGNNKKSIDSESEVRGYIKELEKADFAVSDVKNTQRTKKASAPFITSTLQQEAAKKHGFSAKQTMSVAQKLYEGIEIGKEGPVGLITYMRTDSTRVANEALKAVRGYISKTFGKEYLPPKPISYGKKKAAQDAHEAIRPTYMNLPPERVKKQLTAQQFRLYTLIWNRFVASQMTAATFDVETVLISAGRFMFRVAAEKVVFEGFLRIYHEEKEPDENGNGGNGVDSLPVLKPKDQLRLIALNPTQSFTKPPPRFSEAMLVKELEADGIGRPSTYASIISTLKERKYVDMEQRKLIPTELGNTVSKILVENFPDLFDVGFTAEMERELDAVEEGSDDWVKIVGEFYEPFMETIGELKGKEKEIKASMEEKTDIKCEKCGSPMVIKWGRNGRFLACSAYPSCKSTRPLPEEEARSRTDEKCDKCGSPMVIKTGRFGRFLACSAYPDCKNTKAMKLGIKCPREGCSGDIIEKQTKARRIFYGCSNYPKCDYASWDMPAKVECPACHHPFMLHKVSKTKGEYYRCPECKHQMSAGSAEEKTVA